MVAASKFTDKAMLSDRSMPWFDFITHSGIFFKKLSRYRILLLLHSPPLDCSVAKLLLQCRETMGGCTSGRVTGNVFQLCELRKEFEYA